MVNIDSYALTKGLVCPIRIFFLQMILFLYLCNRIAIFAAIFQLKPLYLWAGIQS